MVCVRCGLCSRWVYVACGQTRTTACSTCGIWRSSYAGTLGKKFCLWPRVGTGLSDGQRSLCAVSGPGLRLVSAGIGSMASTSNKEQCHLLRYSHTEYICNTFATFEKCSMSYSWESRVSVTLAQRVHRKDCQPACQGRVTSAHLTTITMWLCMKKMVQALKIRFQVAFKGNLL